MVVQEAGFLVRLDGRTGLRGRSCRDTGLLAHLGRIFQPNTSPVQDLEPSPFRSPRDSSSAKTETSIYTSCMTRTEPILDGHSPSPVFPELSWPYGAPRYIHGVVESTLYSLHFYSKLLQGRYSGCRESIAAAGDGDHAGGRNCGIARANRNAGRAVQSNGSHRAGENEHRVGRAA
jgi:hypothetical protein